MSSINFLGSYSGIGQETIDQLMRAERLPLNQLSNKKDSIKQKQDAWRDINTRLNSLYDKIKALEKQDSFSSKIAKSTNDKIVSMSPSKNAAEGTYKINVEHLATNTSIIGAKIPSDKFDEDGYFKGTGKFGFENHEGVRFDIEITAEDTLSSLVKKINNLTKDQIDSETGETIDGSGSGITATNIDGHLVLTDTNTGARNIKLIGDGKGTLVNLGLNKDARTTEQGTDAKFTINGVEVTRSSNTITDVIEGTTINLHKQHGEGEYDTVSIDIDVEKATKLVKDFVDQYNSTMEFINEKLNAGDPEVPNSRGTLAGDSSLMRLQSSLRNLVTSRINNENISIKDISQLGISTTDRSGKLQFDSGKFKDALLGDGPGVSEFFNSGNTDGTSTGYSTRISVYIDGFISKSDGIIKDKTKSYDNSLRDLNRQIDRFNERMEKRESYYIRMFAALDEAMMQAESQMAWLQNQVNVMNGIHK